MNYYVPPLADNIYHITGHAVGNEKLFLNDDNYQFFLKRYCKYINPIADTFAYSLLPNHFHSLIQVKPYNHLLENYKKVKSNRAAEAGWQEAFVMQQFSNLFNSYAKSFNKKYNRRGALFMDYMRRVQVTSDEQYTGTIFYIHKNAVHHGYCHSLEEWPWSSYNCLLTDDSITSEQQKVLDWFGGKEKFIAYHTQPVYLKNAAVVEY